MWGEILSILFSCLTISLLIFWLRHGSSLEKNTLNPILLESALDRDLSERVQWIRGREGWTDDQRKRAAYTLVKEAHERYQRAGLKGNERS